MTVELTTKATLPFADRDYPFWLPMPQMNAVEHEIGGSVLALFHSLGSNMAITSGVHVLAGDSDARVKQCHSLIRNALIGGGMPDASAREMVSVYCFPARPAMHDLALAWDILNAAVYGIPPPAVTMTDEGGDETNE